MSLREHLDPERCACGLWSRGLVEGVCADCRNQAPDMADEDDVIGNLRRERDLLMAALWDCYRISGADTDGDTRWHCTPADAARAAVHAVRELRTDYEDDSDLERVMNERDLAVLTLAAFTPADKPQPCDHEGVIYQPGCENCRLEHAEHFGYPADKPLPTIPTEGAEA